MFIVYYHMMSEQMTNENKELENWQKCFRFIFYAHFIDLILSHMMNSILFIKIMNQIEKYFTSYTYVESINRLTECHQFIQSTVAWKYWKQKKERKKMGKRKYLLCTYLRICAILIVVYLVVSFSFSCHYTVFDLSSIEIDLTSNRNNKLVWEWYIQI